MKEFTVTREDYEIYKLETMFNLTAKAPFLRGLFDTGDGNFKGRTKMFAVLIPEELDGFTPRQCCLYMEDYLAPIIISSIRNERE